MSPKGEDARQAGPEARQARPGTDPGREERARPDRAAPEERLERPAPEMRLGFGRIWIGFAVVMLAGAALLLRPEPLWQGMGVFLLLSPVIAFGLLMLAYYVKSRMGPAR